MYIVRKVYGFHVVIYIYYSDKIYTIILKLNKIIINPLKVLRLCSYLWTPLFLLVFFEAVLFFSVFQYYLYNNFIKSYD